MSAPRTRPRTRGKLASSVPAEQLAEIAQLFDHRRAGIPRCPFYTTRRSSTSTAAIFGRTGLRASIAELPSRRHVTVDYGPTP